MEKSPYQFENEDRKFAKKVKDLCEKYNYQQFAVFYAAPEDNKTLHWFASWEADRDSLIEQLESAIDYLKETGP